MKGKRNVGAQTKAQKEKGITLIALVITIIVMLILVAVTITMAVNGGLFNYAGRAATQTNETIDAEQQLANLEANMTVDELIEKATNPKGLKILAEVASIGDLVNYDPGNGVFNWSDYSFDSTNFASLEDGTQNNFEAQNYTGDWRILNIDDEGYVYLISDSAVGSLYLYGKAAYDHVESYRDDDPLNLLNLICAEYCNDEFASLGRGPLSSDEDFINLTGEAVLTTKPIRYEFTGSEYVISFRLALHGGILWWWFWRK